VARERFLLLSGIWPLGRGKADRGRRDSGPLAPLEWGQRSTIRAYPANACASCCYPRSKAGS